MLDVISCEVFLTGNSAGELYTAKAIDTLRPSWRFERISCGRESVAFKLRGKSSDVSALFDVDSCNSEPDRPTESVLPWNSSLRICAEDKLHLQT